MRAWRNRQRCRAPERPWAWLATITHNEAMRHRARPAASAEAGGELPEAGALDDSLEAAADRLTVWPAIAALSERDRTIMLLHYKADMTVSSIARAVDMPTGTVKVKLLRIRDKLRSGLMA